MLDARSDRHAVRRIRPLRSIVSLIVLAAFLFNSVSYDFAWAGRTPSELTSVGSDRAVSLDDPVSPGASNYKSLSVSTFALPHDLGVVRDSWSPSSVIARSGGLTQATKQSQPIIIHIQDAHCNYYAQRAIADIIDYLSREYGVMVINLEGGARRYDLSPFTSIKDKELRERASDFFLKEGLVSGAEYFAINNPEKVSLWGIEDTKLYIDNLRAYRASMKYKEDAVRLLNNLSRMLSNLKLKIYSKDLLELDLKYTQNKNGSLDFKDYLNYLMAKSKEKIVNTSELGGIFLLNQAFRMEGEIDFKKADAERDRLVADMQKRLSKNAMKELAGKLATFKDGAVSQKDFYKYLISKAATVNLSIQDYPEFEKYVVYISTYAAVDKAKILEEVSALETKIREAIFRNEKERSLDRLSRDLAILKNIFNVTLSRADYRYYKENESAFDMARYISFIGREAPLFGVTAKLDDGVRRLDGYRADMCNFYEYSFKRDLAFVNNMKNGDCPAGSNLTQVGTVPIFSQPRPAILVTGGFHTENLAELFKQNDIPYISIIPNFTSSPGYVSPYFKILSGENTMRIRDQLPTVLKSALATPSQLSELDEAVRRAGLDTQPPAVSEPPSDLTPVATEPVIKEPAAPGPVIARSNNLTPATTQSQPPAATLNSTRQFFDNLGLNRLFTYLVAAPIAEDFFRVALLPLLLPGILTALTQGLIDFSGVPYMLTYSVVQLPFILSHAFNVDEYQAQGKSASAITLMMAGNMIAPLTVSIVGGYAIYVLPNTMYAIAANVAMHSVINALSIAIASIRARVAGSAVTQISEPAAPGPVIARSDGSASATTQSQPSTEPDTPPVEVSDKELLEGIFRDAGLQDVVSRFGVEYLMELKGIAESLNPTISIFAKYNITLPTIQFSHLTYNQSNVTDTKISEVEAWLILKTRISNLKNEYADLIEGLRLISGLIEDGYIDSDQLKEVVRLSGGNIVLACKNMNEMDPVIRAHGLSWLIKLAGEHTNAEKNIYIIAPGHRDHFGWLAKYKDLMMKYGVRPFVVMSIIDGKLKGPRRINDPFRFGILFDYVMQNMASDITDEQLAEQAISNTTGKSEKYIIDFDHDYFVNLITGFNTRDVENVFRYRDMIDIWGYEVLLALINGRKLSDLYRDFNSLGFSRPTEVHVKIIREFVAMKGANNINQERLYFYVLKLIGEAERLNAITNENKRGQEINKLIKAADRSYLDFIKKVSIGEVISDYSPYLALLIGLSKNGAVADVLKIASALGIETKDRKIEDIMAEIDTKIPTVALKKEYVSDPVDFKVSETELDFPESVETKLKQAISDVFRNSADISIDDVRRRLQEVDDKVNEINEDFLDDYNIPASLRSQLLDPATAEKARDNIKRLVYKKIALTPQEMAWFMLKTFERMGIVDVLGRYIGFTQGNPVSPEERQALMLALAEADRQLEDELQSSGVGGLLDNIKRSEGWEVITEVKSRIEIKKKSDASLVKKIQVVFRRKNLLTLYQGRYSGTCFGDHPYDMAREDILVANILKDGELAGAILFNIQGNRLIMLGFDPSQALVGSLDNSKKAKLTGLLMNEVKKFARANGFTLFFTTEAGGLSNRKGFERNIIKRYANTDRRLRFARSDRRTYQPSIRYEVTSAFLAKGFTDKSVAVQDQAPPPMGGGMLPEDLKNRLQGMESADEILAEAKWHNDNGLAEQLPVIREELVRRGPAAADALKKFDDLYPGNASPVVISSDTEPAVQQDTAKVAYVGLDVPVYGGLIDPLPLMEVGDYRLKENDALPAKDIIELGGAPIERKTITRRDLVGKSESVGTNKAYTGDASEYTFFEAAPLTCVCVVLYDKYRKWGAILHLSTSTDVSKSFNTVLDEKYFSRYPELQNKSDNLEVRIIGGSEEAPGSRVLITDIFNELDARNMSGLIVERDLLPVTSDTVALKLDTGELFKVIEFSPKKTGVSKGSINLPSVDTNNYVEPSVPEALNMYLSSMRKAYQDTRRSIPLLVLSIAAKNSKQVTSGNAFVGTADEYPYFYALPVTSVCVTFYDRAKKWAAMMHISTLTDVSASIDKVVELYNNAYPNSPLNTLEARVIGGKSGEISSEITTYEVINKLENIGINVVEKDLLPDTHNTVAMDLSSGDILNVRQTSIPMTPDERAEILKYYADNKSAKNTGSNKDDEALSIAEGLADYGINIAAIGETPDAMAEASRYKSKNPSVTEDLSAISEKIKQLLDRWLSLKRGDTKIVTTVTVFDEGDGKKHSVYVITLDGNQYILQVGDTGSFTATAPLAGTAGPVAAKISRAEKVNAKLAEQVKAATAAQGDVHSGTADWFLLPDGGQHKEEYKSKTAANRAQLRRLFNNGGNTHINNYAYTSEDSEEDFKTQMSRAIKEMAADMARTGDDKRPYAFISAPDKTYRTENGVEVTGYDITVKLIKENVPPNLVDKFVVIKEAIPDDGVINEAIHVDLGRELLNYKRNETAATQDEVKRLVAHIRTLVKNPDEISTAPDSEKKTLDDLLNGRMKLELIRPVNWDALDKEQKAYIALRQAA